MIVRTGSRSKLEAGGSSRPRFEEVVGVLRAFILIQTEVGAGASVAQQIRSLDHVVSVEVVTGPYDLVVRAESTGIDELGKLVLRPIQEVRGVIRTMTCPVIER
jgi:DNA-binding Lrp family transcriptional regulator